MTLFSNLAILTLVRMTARKAHRKPWVKPRAMPQQKGVVTGKTKRGRGRREAGEWWAGAAFPRLSSASWYSLGNFINRGRGIDRRNTGKCSESGFSPGEPLNQRTPRGKA